VICSGIDCDRPAHARGLCAKHYSRWGRHRDPERVDPIEGRPPKHGVPGYHAAHKRVMRARGRAAGYICSGGCGRAAQHWALVATPVLFDIDIGLGYSLDINDYSPLCVPCHHDHDGIGIGLTLERGAHGRIVGRQL
jgi:hypothetical protein